MADLRYVHGKKPIRIWSVTKLTYVALVVSLLVMTMLAVVGVVG